MSKIDTLNTELESYVEDVEDLKEQISDIALGKGVPIVGGIDTPSTVLTKIDNATIATPSGTFNITTNNTYDVTNYASVDVSVTGGDYDINISSNVDNTYDMNILHASSSTIDTTEVYKNVKYENTALKTHSNTGLSLTVLSNRSNMDIRGFDTLDVSVSSPYSLQDYINDNGSGAYLFYGSKILNIDNILADIDISNVSNISYMLAKLDALSITIPSTLDTRHIDNMSHLFEDCSNAILIDVNYLNTSNAIDMSYMFRNCSEITGITVSNFATNYVTNMSGMFSGCNKLTGLDLSNFEFASVTSLNSMFMSCSRMSTLTLPQYLDLYSCTDFSSMFNNCASMTSINLGSNQMSQCRCNAMFGGCSSLTSISMPSFVGPQSATYASGMFTGCRNLQTLDISSWDMTGYTTANINSIFGTANTGVPSNCSITVNNNTTKSLLESVRFTNVTVA